MLAGQALICPQCGNLRSVCSDDSVDWHPQETYCYATAAVTWKWRKLREEYPAELKIDGAHALDGLSVWASDLDLDSLRLPTQQAHGDEG